MPHGKALKAVAGKRLKVIYAIVRDRVPYAAWRAAGKSRIPKPLGEEGSAELSLLPIGRGTRPVDKTIGTPPHCLENSVVSRMLV